MPMILINIALAVSGFMGAVVAIGGETWLKIRVPVYQRITHRGWLAIGCLLLTLALGVVKELQNAQTLEEQQIETKQLRSKLSEMTEQLSNAQTTVAELSGDLQDTGQRLDRTQHLLENVIRSGDPSVVFRKLITEKIVHLANKNGLPGVRFAEYENVVTYDFRDNNDKRQGFLALRNEDILELSLQPVDDLDSKLQELMFGKWGDDDLDKDWNLISENIIKIAQHILNDRFDTDGITVNYDPDNRALTIYPIDKSGDRLSKGEIHLGADAIVKLLEVPPVQRGAIIGTYCDELK